MCAVGPYAASFLCLPTEVILVLTDIECLAASAGAIAFAPVCLQLGGGVGPPTKFPDDTPSETRLLGAHQRPKEETLEPGTVERTIPSVVIHTNGCEDR
ncbi:hypothetical protein MATL_G00257950 [Megalops atlanticus]|uniref:Uncharacterized protein n=1 Tax=Megalops atlanticus TaxID=7932 RepID=A0A9D3PDM2_MEGAT|nr:hypothetical protein MATL_G00257950 [Megalops atlanticus]